MRSKTALGLFRKCLIDLLAALISSQPCRGTMSRWSHACDYHPLSGSSGNTPNMAGAEGWDHR
jgi:hypothetical protein